MLEYRSAAKLLNTYIIPLEKWYDDNGRVHSSFQLHRTVTGRLSTRDPSLQNIPEEGFEKKPELDIRALYIAPPGKVLLYADYSQAELRVAAVLSQAPFLMEAYKRGDDLHTQAAIDRYGPDFTPRQRFFIKTVNFGILYGRSAASLARDTRLPGMTQAVAAQYVRDYFARMPAVRQWIRVVQQRTRQHGYAETSFGRRRRFGLITGETVGRIQRQAVNFMCQSTASDITLTALIRLTKRLHGLAEVLLTVHDSILFECLPQHLAEVARIVKETMVEVPLEFLGDTVPFTVALEVGQRWGELTPYEEKR